MTNNAMHTDDDRRHHVDGRNRCATCESTDPRIEAVVEALKCFEYNMVCCQDGGLRIFSVKDNWDVLITPKAGLLHIVLDTPGWYGTTLDVDSAAEAIRFLRWYLGERWTVRS